jgi:hypothetical protein
MIAALGDMVRHAGSDDASDAGHQVMTTSKAVTVSHGHLELPADEIA